VVKIKKWRRGQDNDAVTVNVPEIGSFFLKQWEIMGSNESKQYSLSFPLREKTLYYAFTFRCKIYVAVCRVLL
jgi:hypothetical protein